MNKCKYFLFFFLILFLPSLTYATAGSVSGTVVDIVNNTPLSGVTITITALGTNQQLVTTTANNGYYSFSNLPTGNYSMKVLGENFQMQQSALFVNPLYNVVNFALVPDPASVSGTVYDAVTGATIPYAKVYVSQSSIPTSTVTANLSGQYTASNLRPGNYGVSAESNGYQTATVGVSLSPNENYTGLDLYLEDDPGTISGTISSSTNAIIADANINFYANGIAVSGVTSSDTGVYTKGNLAPGIYTVTASASNYQTASSVATVVSGGTTPLNFSLETTTGAVSGQITDEDNNPIIGARVTALQENTILGQTLTSSSGIYNITGLAPGNYLLQAEKTSYLSATQQITIAADQLLIENIELENGSSTGVTGIVKNSNSNLPISGAQIQILQGTIILRSALTNNLGSYTISDILPNTYTIFVSKNSFQSASGTSTIIENTLTEQNFSLEAGLGNITGKVTASVSGSELAMATVTAIQDEKFYGSASTDSAGDYTITGLAEGTYSIQASKDTYQTALESANVTTNESTTLNIALLTDPNIVSGVITNAITNAPISGAYVQVSSVDNSYLSSIITQSDGSYSITGLSSGTYTLFANISAFIPNTSAPFSVTTSIAMEDITEDLSLTPVDSNPQNVIGMVLNNRYALQTDRIHRLSWEPSESIEVLGYRIYRNGVVIGNIGINVSPLVFEDHNRSPNKLDFYRITSVNSDGSQSTGELIKLQ